jgi:hypothetical protein
MIFEERFDSDADWHHSVLVIRPDSSQYETEIGNVFSPRDWVAWYQHDPGTWDQPEAGYIWARDGYAERIQAGAGAYKLFTFYRRHDAGLLRIVKVAPGTRLRLSAWSHAWSNGLSAEHGGKLDYSLWSDGSLVGERVVALTQDEIPPLSPSAPEKIDRQNDANGNIRQQIGIDPTGGIYPLSGSVIWSEPLYIYNGYARQHVIEATAGNRGVVTIWLRSRTLWPFKHNDVYWDSVTLEALGEEQEPDCEGLPREQYDRTYHVLPASTPAERVGDIVAGLWAEQPVTAGPSYDDAGIGALEHKRAVLWDIDETDRAEYEAWYIEHYPGTFVEFAGEGQPPTPGDPWQRDIRADLPTNDDCPPPLDNGWWRRSLDQIDGVTLHHTLGDDPIALAERYVQKDGGRPSIPYTLWIARDGTTSLCNDLEAGCWHDHTGHENTHLSIGLAGRLDTNPPTEAQIDAAARASAWAVQHPGMGVDADTVRGHQDYIATICPGWATWRSEFYAALAEALGEDPPEPEPEPEPEPAWPVGAPTSLHCQNLIAGVEQFVRDVRPGVIKLLAGMEDAPTMRQWSRWTLPIWRQHRDHQAEFVWHPDGPRAGAAAWVDLFRDSLHAVCEEFRRRIPDIEAPFFAVESVNEEYPTFNAEKLARVVEFDTEFIREIEATGLPILPVVFTAAVGNPHETEYSALLPLAAETVAHQRRTGWPLTPLWGYHGYWWIPHGQTQHLLDDWEWFAGRWMEIDRLLVANGYRVNWALTETGAYESVERGWRAPECLSGDWEEYRREILVVDRKIKEWNKQHGGRCLGQTLFTVNQFAGWEWFKLAPEEIVSLIEALI